jgi:two-component SAPR family response regulator
MNILVVDNNLATHDELVRCVQEVWPQAQIDRFTDPLLALKHGMNHPADLLVTAIQMRVATGQDLARILREHHPNLQVVYVTDTPLRRRSDFEVPPDGVVQLPVTTDKLQKFLNTG